MRVLHVIEATIGGTRRHVVDLVGGLARAGVDVALAAAVEREPAFRVDLERLAAAGVRIHEVPMVRSIRPGRDLSTLKRLQRVMVAEAPDVVHTHSSKGGVLGRLASMQCEVGRRVHTPHTFAFLFESMFGRIQRGIYRQLETHLGASTERMIAVSAGEAETMCASGVIAPGKVRTVPNGVDPTRFAGAQPVPLPSPAGAPTVLVGGLLNVAKGQDVAIRALGEPGAEQVHLLLAGHGEEERALRALTQALGLGERIHFLGWRDDLPGLMAACDLICVPSRWEGMPYVVLEAMAAARPVVATRVDGSRELVDETTGALVDIEDAVSLGACFARLLGPERHTLADRGRCGAQRVAAGYSQETMVAGTRAVYGELV